MDDQQDDFEWNLGDYLARDPPPRAVRGDRVRQRPRRRRRRGTRLAARLSLDGNDSHRAAGDPAGPRPLDDHELRRSAHSAHQPARHDDDQSARDRPRARAVCRGHRPRGARGDHRSHARPPCTWTRSARTSSIRAAGSRRWRRSRSPWGSTSRSPQLAARVANELTSLYLQENSESRRLASGRGHGVPGR